MPVLFLLIAVTTDAVRGGGLLGGGGENVGGRRGAEEVGQFVPGEVGRVRHG